MEKIRKEILSELDLLDILLDQMIRELETKDHVQLIESKQVGQWSPLQVCMHMYLAEKRSLAYVKKKLSFDPNLKKAGIVTWIRHLTLQWYLKSSFKFKAPKATTVFDETLELSLGKIKRDWLQERQAMRLYLTSVPATFLDKTVYRHPIVGRLSLLQMVRFFTVHFERHLEQIHSRLD